MTRSTFLKVFSALPFLQLITPTLTLTQSHNSGLDSTMTKTNGLLSSEDLSRLLRCIAEVETGNDDTKIGRNGERSKYQISEAVWAQHIPDKRFKFEDWCLGYDATSVARSHIHWLSKCSGISQQIWPLAYMWHRGLAEFEHVVDNQLTLFSPYADRVTNLFYDETFAPDYPRSA